MSSSAFTHSDLMAVLALVEERAGLAPPSCLTSAEEGVLRAMERVEARSMPEYLERLTQDVAALDDLLNELTIGETYFFRTPEHFEHVRRVILPELREQHGPTYSVRAWSAACSSGEEPYSLAAVMLAEGWGTHMAVTATDVSRTALARARQGRYGEWSLRGNAMERIRPWLRPEGRHYLLSPELKQSVRFSYLNLAQETWPSPDTSLWRLDIIFCRNVLIYFNRPTIEGVARRLHAALNEGGYLFMGPSDPPLGDLAPFQTVLTDWGVLYRRAPPSIAISVPETVAPPPAREKAGVPGAPPMRRPPSSPGLPAVPAAAFASGAPGASSPGAGAPLPGAQYRSTSGAPGSSGARTPGSSSVPGSSPSGSSRNTAGAPATVSEPPPRTVSAEALDGARRALERGQWREAAKRAGALDSEPDLAVAAIRALANLDPEAAIYACAEASLLHPLVPTLRALEAVLRLGRGQLDEAERAARQALYLEPSMVVAWLVLAQVLQRRGDRTGARRAWREAESLCAALPPDALVPFTEGERAGRLVEVCRRERARLAPAGTEGEEEH